MPPRARPACARCEACRRRRERCLHAAYRLGGSCRRSGAWDAPGELWDTPAAQAGCGRLERGPTSVETGAAGIELVNIHERRRPGTDENSDARPALLARLGVSRAR